ncbi:ABC-type nitrate/sulfonate/bicarbonate transport system substrate-binding protein [Lipingzhangella halophila]|uniref:ABC-type nitrate/sulfonate/bicarbonate transport system substrate-binding protein n=1 Tax=Lipingzhangella halophila TaxID=1783352 RepID=A0A7W7RNK2_9ACTN|nr:ABC transporter substrate-binding protein [Lipingzhangella halophila]MBB4935275.1 ABC-type nitrate/sulfonate/bicarbonate transport system substrate-binding protein [Lipingzhangella halophila]
MTTATNTRRGRLLVAASALSALVLSVSGCADRSSETAEGTLNVGQISDSVAFFALHVAEERGYFEEEGVELGERPRLGTGAKVAAALQSGSIDLGAGVLTDALNMHGTDDSTRLVSNLVEKYYVDIIVGEDFDGPAEDASLEDRIAALEGTKIGITGPGSGTEALVNFLFEREGLDAENDAELVNLGGDPAGALGALESGQVDALSFFQPVPQQAEATEVGSIYISPVRGDIPDLENPTHGVVFANESVLENKSDEVAAFQTAIERANEDIKEDPEIRELLAGYMEGIDEEARDELLPLMQEQLPPEPGFEQGSVETALEFHEDTGLVSDPPGYEEIVPEDLRR